VAALGGLIIGLLLAWQVFPVRFVDTDPSDLRAEHQADYVAMVADSWTVSGDADLARERLYELVDDDTGWDDVDTLLQETAGDLGALGNSAASLRIARLRDSVPLPEGSAALPDAEAVPGAAEADATAIPEAESEETERSSGWLIPVAGLIIVLAAAAAIAYLVIKGRRSAGIDGSDEQTSGGISPTMEERRRGSAVSPNPLPSLGGLDGQLVADEETPALSDLDLQGDSDSDGQVFEDLEAEAPEAEPLEAPLAHAPAMEREEGWHYEEVAEQDDQGDDEQVMEQESSEDDADEEDVEPLSELPEGEILNSRNWPRRAPAATPALAPGQLGVFETTYSFGDDDFYHAFTIESATHEFLGQCGIVISDVLGTGEGQMVDAFDIWLFETQGTRTLSKVLVSDSAFHDEAISAKLARKGELVVAQPGLVMELATESITLTATIEGLAYREQAGDANSVFDRLKVRMVVEQ